MPTQDEKSRAKRLKRSFEIGNNYSFKFADEQMDALDLNRELRDEDGLVELKVMALGSYYISLLDVGEDELDYTDKLCPRVSTTSRSTGDTPIGPQPRARRKTPGSLDVSSPTRICESV